MSAKLLIVSKFFGSLVVAMVCSASITSTEVISSANSRSVRGSRLRIMPDFLSFSVTVLGAN